MAHALEDSVAEFDSVYVIVGKQMRSIEGKVLRRSFFNELANLSPVAAQRNHEVAIRALGGVKADALGPDHPALAKANTVDTTVRQKLGF